MDFNESSAKVHDVMTQKLEDISYEDKKFLKIMDDQTVKVGNHYQTPLSMRNPVMKTLNNRKMAEKRAQYLKKRFEKDSKYFCHYKEFMEEILSKGYAKISKDTPTDGRVWYLPHHGVYHPAKPNKIRVVFDCSAEYAGRSINKELMAGPDLTNQIVGTLIRFRQERIAFVANIEKMFSSEPALLSVVARWGFEKRASGSRDVCACVWWHIFAILQQLCPQKNFH